MPSGSLDYNPNPVTQRSALKYLFCDSDTGEALSARRGVDGWSLREKQGKLEHAWALAGAKAGRVLLTVGGAREAPSGKIESCAIEGSAARWKRGMNGGRKTESEAESGREKNPNANPNSVRAFFFGGRYSLHAPVVNSQATDKLCLRLRRIEQAVTLSRGNGGGMLREDTAAVMALSPLVRMWLYSPPLGNWPPSFTACSGGGSRTSMRV